MLSSTLKIPASNREICTAILNDTTVDVFSLHREQQDDDEADKSLLLRSVRAEHDIAFSPKAQPLSRYVGLPGAIKATLVSGWEMYAASTENLAKWNIKVCLCLSLFAASRNQLPRFHFPSFQNSALIWTIAFEGERATHLIDIEHLWPGRLLAVMERSVCCYSQRTGRLVWQSDRIPEAASWDEFEHGIDEDEEDHLIDSFTRVKKFFLDETRGWLWLAADCSLAALNIKTGAFVTPIQPPAAPLAERQAAATRAKAAKTPVGYSAAAAEWAAPPAWSRGGDVSAPVVPGFEDSIDHIILPQSVHAHTAKVEPSLSSCQLPGAAIVASGGTGGVYAWSAAGQPMWYYLAPPPPAGQAKPKRDTSHLHAVVAMAYSPRRNLVIASDDESVFALNADTGKRLGRWGVSLRSVWGKTYVEHLSVNHSRDTVLLIGDKGRLLLLDASSGQLLRYFASPMFNAEISDFAAIQHPRGTLRSYKPSALASAASQEGEHLPSWSGPAQNKFVVCTVLVQDMNTASLAAIDIVADDDLCGASRATVSSSSDLDVVLDVDVSNPMRDQGDTEHPCDRITGKIQACVMWHASGRNADFGSGAVCPTPEGVLLVGKRRGDIEAWNITSSAMQSALPEHKGPIRWSKSVTDYLHFKAPWSAGESHNQAAEDAAKAALLAKLKGGGAKKKGGEKAVELSDADADYSLLVPDAGVLVTSHSNGHLRAWQVSDGSLKWVAAADTSDVADHVQYMAAFSSTSSSTPNCVAVFAEIDEVATVVAFDLRSGETLWRQAVFPKAYMTCDLRGLVSVPSNGTIVAAFAPYVADPDEADEWAVKLTPQQKAEAKKDYENKPLIFVTLKSQGGGAYQVVGRRVLRRFSTDDDCLQSDESGMTVVVSNDTLTKIDLATGQIVWRMQLPQKGMSVGSWHWLKASGIIIVQQSKAVDSKLLSIDAESGKVLASGQLHGKASQHVAACGLVACIEPGRGVRLLAARTLQPLHEHPFQFNGVPSRAAFVTGHSTSCVESCNPGRRSLMLAAGAVTDTDPVPQRLVVLGTSGEVFSLNLADFLGPLHLSSRLELGAHADAKGIKKFQAEQGLRLQAYVAAILKLVDFVQMASFAFQAAVPPSLEDSSNNLEDFQGLGLDFITYPVLLFMTVGVVLLFTAVFAVSEKVEGWAFLNPNNSKATLSWTALKIFAQVMTSVALIPIMNTLASAIDCTDKGGKLVWDAHGDGVECFTGNHLLYVILAVLAFLLYIPNVIRLLQVGSSLDGIELQVLRPWDWTGDDRSEMAVEHLLSEKRSIYSTVQAVIKVLAAVLLTLFGQQRRILVSALVVVLGCVLVTVGVFRPPFHYALACQMRTALDAGITWTFVSSFVAALVIGDGQDAASDLDSSQDTILSVLPAGILLVLPIALFVQWYLCCSSCCGQHLSQYTSSTSKAAVGPRTPHTSSSSAEVASPLTSGKAASAAPSGVTIPSPLANLPMPAAVTHVSDIGDEDFNALAVQQHSQASDDDASDDDASDDDASDDDASDDDASASGGGGSAAGSLNLDLDLDLNIG